MRESELRAHAECSACRKKIGHTGIPLFWTARAVRHGLDAGALRRQTGLEMMIGVPLAGVMGPGEEMTQTVLDEEITLCEECALPLVQLLARCGKF